MGANPAQVYVISDVEGTLTQGVMWKAIGAYLNAYVSPEIHRRFLRRNLPRMLLFRFGLLERSSFQNRWIADQARLLEGRTSAEMAEFSRWIVAEDLWPKRQEAVIAELLEWRGKGAAIILASGLYQSIVEAFAEKLAASPYRPVLGSARTRRPARTRGQARTAPGPGPGHPPGIFRGSLHRALWRSGVQRPGESPARR